MQKKIGILFQAAIGLILFMGPSLGMAKSISLTYQGKPYDQIIEGGTKIDPNPSRFMSWKLEFDDSALDNNQLDAFEIDYFEMTDSFHTWNSNFFDVCYSCSFGAKLKFNPGTLTVLEFSIFAFVRSAGGSSDWLNGDETCSDVTCVEYAASSIPGAWIATAIPLPAPIWLLVSGLLGIVPMLRQRRTMVE
jgi:hypothetical protein